VHLFCFSHAGGSANVYLSWRRALDSSIELVPVELAGRGRRIGAPLNHRFADVLDDAVGEVTRGGAPTEYALLGHSFGALVAYELAHVLARHGGPPRHLFISASCAPERVGEIRIPLAGDDRELLRSLSYLGGTPHEILADDEAVSLFAPILRADLEALFDYRFVPGRRLPCDISVLLGSGDAVASTNDAEQWGALVDGRLSTRILDGGHFAPLENPVAAASWVNDMLGRPGRATALAV
jgi:surfactin synthase thioesterase subunit